MASPTAVPFRLTVLNPGGRDPQQYFASAAEQRAHPHPPTNFHAYAACTGGSFQRGTKLAIAENTPVLLLLRGNFSASERALILLKRAGRTVAISLKETGLHQIAEQMRDAAKLARFLRIVRLADACLAPTPEAASIYGTIRGESAGIGFIPTPYPLEESAWNLSRPTNERSGIFIGTREWDVPSRNHCAALFAARQISTETGERVTVFNFDGRKGARLLAQMEFEPGKLRVLEQKLPYREYLGEIARHKIVFQLDTSFVPGQVAGDALLCRLPCVGGNGAIDRLAFPGTCGFARAMDDLKQLATRLLTDEKFYEASMATIEKDASQQLSFAVVAKQLDAFFSEKCGRGGGSYRESIASK